MPGAEWYTRLYWQRVAIYIHIMTEVTEISLNLKTRVRPSN